ncbi:MAG: outer membrane protein assembly factor BamE, partial [Bdellovibrionota bacterium]
LFSFIAALLTAGCQTVPPISLARVQNGMTKDQVLEVAGSPNYSRRWQGKDRWSYRPAGQSEQEILFADGKVVYVGDKVQPAVPASEVDRRNAQGLSGFEKEILEAKPQYEEIK